jgi:hypothetical protein
MTKIKIEIDDVLPDCVETAIDAVRDLLVDHLMETDYLGESAEGECPCLSNDLDDSGDVHSIVDNAVPHRTSDIEAAWFLHGRDLEDSYESAGAGENPRENHGMAAIYYYIHDKVNEWYADNAVRICDEFRQDRGLDET